MASLFTPLEIKQLRFANRIVLPPMATEAATEEGAVSEKNVAAYQRLAACGMGLLVLEHNFIAVSGRVSGRQMSIAREEDVAGHRRLTELFSDRGVPAALQLNHSGSNRANPPFAEGIGASAVAHPTTGIVPQELLPAQIAELVSAFGQAADRGRRAGYDLVEVHCAHGYLLSQFLSPLTNRRGDRYGGSEQNRRRFLLEVVEEVRATLKEKALLLVRLGLADNPPGHVVFPLGLTVSEGVRVAQALDAAKIDILDLSAGLCGSRPAGVTGEGYFLPFAEAVRGKVKIPLILTGGITKPESAEAIIAGKKADFVGIGRALAAELHWIDLARQALGA